MNYLRKQFEKETDDNKQVYKTPIRYTTVFNFSEQDACWVNAHTSISDHHAYVHFDESLQQRDVNVSHNVDCV